VLNGLSRIAAITVYVPQDKLATCANMRCAGCLQYPRGNRLGAIVLTDTLQRVGEHGECESICLVSDLAALQASAL
jgi:hypothetical protein